MTDIRSRIRRVDRRRVKQAAILAVVILAVLWVFHFNGNSLDPTDRQVVLVVTDSMDGDVTEFDIDSFPADTLVMVQHLSPYETQFLRIGDVISYRDSGALVHHRVVLVGEGYVYVHGDNNHSTEKVMLEDVNGRVIGTSWVAGHLMAFISGNFLAFLAALFAVSSALVVYAVYSGRGEEVAE